MRSHCFGSTLGARHMRGLEEKIWNVLAPISRARSTALEAPPAVPRCTPMRLVMRPVYRKGRILFYADRRRSARARPGHLPWRRAQRSRINALCVGIPTAFLREDLPDSARDHAT